LNKKREEAFELRVGRRPAHSVSAIAGLLVALLIFAQGLGAYVSAPAHVRHGNPEAGVAVSSLGVFCQADMSGGGKSPSREHSNCLECCVLCFARDYGTPSIYVATGDGATQLPALAASAPIARQYIEDDDGRPIGWASSWSSRAPPNFS
jgi:hypothetical protein